jgi:hypothetical protein
MKVILSIAFVAVVVLGLSRLWKGRRNWRQWPLTKPCDPIEDWRKKQRR